MTTCCRVIIRGDRPGDALSSDVFDQAMTKPWLSTQAREESAAAFPDPVAARLHLHGGLRGRRDPGYGAGAGQGQAVALT